MKIPNRSVNQIKARRSATASSLVEVIFGTAIVIPVLLVLMDAAVLLGCYFLNVTICASAARAVSMGPPSQIEPNGPRARAEKVIRDAVGTQSLFSINPKVNITESVKVPPDVDVFGGQIQGQISLQTQADVKLPFVLPEVMQLSSLRVSAIQTYPYTWIVVPKSSCKG